MKTYFIYRGDITVIRCFLKLANIIIENDNNYSSPAGIRIIVADGKQPYIRIFPAGSLVDCATKYGHVDMLENKFVILTEQSFIEKAQKLFMDSL